MKIKEAIDDINLDLQSIKDTALKSTISKLLNVIEDQAKVIKALREENQKLRDENNNLKGEQGKPDIRPQTKPRKDVSSEKERKRKNKKKNGKGKKKNKIKINRVKYCRIDKNQLPLDAKFKGYYPVLVQDIKIITDNTRFLKEIYYSKSLNKTFVASLPKGYKGEFGPNIKSVIISLYNDSKMTELAITDFVKTHGIMIAPSTVSRILTDDHEGFHQEKKDIINAGLLSTVHQQMDDTGARVNGKNNYTHILCNEFYTAYFTRPHKDRLTILEILTQGELMFQFNKASFSLMEQLNLSNKSLTKLININPEKLMNRAKVDALLIELFPDPKKHKTNRRIILEASAITAYQQLPHAISLLLVDDAPQFKQITSLLALCWIHDGRHYKKLSPVINLHQKKAEGFLERYWDYYHKLLDYKETFNANFARKLSDEFDELFSTKTGYDQLDERIKKSKMKKASLLLVLEYPDLPLHNNASELGARAQARRRDINLQTKNEKGTEAKDTFMTIVETSKKLGVNVFQYILDRVSKKFEMPSLSSMIKNHSKNAAFNTS